MLHLRLYGGLRACCRHASSNSEERAAGYAKKYTQSKMKEYLETFGSGGKVVLGRHPKFNDIATIQINHPEKKNAFSGKMMVQLHTAVKRLADQSDYKVVLLRASEAPFCSGADLELVRKLNNEEGVFVMHNVMATALRGLAALPVPVIAAIDGAALGGGSELVSVCDVRFGKEGCKVGFVQGRMGVSPGWGGAEHIVQALGRARAIHYLSTAAIVDSKELLQIGYLQGVYRTEEELEVYLKRYTSLDASVLVASKAVVTAFSDKDTSQDKAQQIEADVFATLWGGPLQQEALANMIKHK